MRLSIRGCEKGSEDIKLEERNLRAREYLRKKREQKVDRFADCIVLTFGVTLIALVIELYGVLYYLCKGII